MTLPVQARSASECIPTECIPGNGAGGMHLLALRACISTVGEVRINDCAVCGNRRFLRPFPRRLPWIARCQDCGMVFCDPQPSADELAGIYDGDYYQTFGYRASNRDAYRTMKQISCERLLKRLGKRLGTDTSFTVVANAGSVGHGRLLDVGSALGDLISVARLGGWDVTGIEPNVYAAAEADRLIPGATFCGTLDQFDGEPAAFGAITCCDVLEHLRRPDVELRRMFELLRPGGELLITTVDVRGWQSRLFGSRWVHYHRDHLWYFSRQTLARMAAAAGFEVVKCGPASKTFNLDYILGILSAQSNFGLQQRVAKLGLSVLPRSWLRKTLPPLREGLLLVARRPFG